MSSPINLASESTKSQWAVTAAVEAARERDSAAPALGTVSLTPEDRRRMAIIPWALAFGLAWGLCLIVSAVLWWPK